MTTVIFRADAAPAIGIGHVMRCLAVAEALQAEGDTPVFAAVCLPERLSRRILDLGVALRAIPAAAPGDAGDLAGTIELAREVGAGGIVLDGYDFDEGWRLVLSRAVRPVLAFDDLAQGASLSADLVVNASPAAFALPYPSLAPGATLLLGPRYAPLRREIRDALAGDRPALSNRREVLVSFGGSDPLGLTQAVLAVLPALLPAGITLQIVCGSSAPGIDEVRQAAARQPTRVRLHVDPPDLSRLMTGAGLALSGGGGTMAELAALGVPSLVAIIADNQEPGVRAAERAGWVEAFDARGATDAGGALARRAQHLWQDQDRREALARAAAGTFDGQGAARIAAALRAGMAARPAAGSGT